MRISRSNEGLNVLAVAGTSVVLLGFDLKREDCDGLLGFSIHRTGPQGRDARFLEGMKTFIETDPGFPPSSTYSTEQQPIQSFQWADYSAEPGHTYIYTITALKGMPSQLAPFKSVSVKVTTESPESGNHDVYFNRGVAASQEYVRRFGGRLPSEVQNGQAFIWLSRGLYEAMSAFVRECIPGKHQLRISAYEFNYRPFLKLLREFASRGVYIKIIFDARKAQPQKSTREAIADRFGNHGSARQACRYLHRAESRSMIYLAQQILRKTRGWKGIRCLDRRHELLRRWYFRPFECRACCRGTGSCRIVLEILVCHG